MRISYQLTAPMIIGSRLLPAVKIGDDGYLYVQMHAIEDDGRTHWQIILDTPVGSFASEPSFVTIPAAPGADPTGSDGVTAGAYAARVAAEVCDALMVDGDTAPEWVPAELGAWVVDHTYDFADLHLALTSEPCERCREMTPADEIDEDSGLCPKCVAYNDSRVAL